MDQIRNINRHVGYGNSRNFLDMVMNLFLHFFRQHRDRCFSINECANHDFKSGFRDSNPRLDFLDATHTRSGFVGQVLDRVHRDLDIPVFVTLVNRGRRAAVPADRYVKTRMLMSSNTMATTQVPT